MDDAIEVIALMLVSAMIGTRSDINVKDTLLALFVLFFLTVILIKMRKGITREFGIRTIKYHLLGISLLVFFLFLAIGKYAEATAIAALLSGITLSNFLPKHLLEKIESEIRVLAYGFFGPIFFLWVGATISLNSVFSAPILALAIFAVASFSKIFSSLVVTRKKLGFKPAILLGTSLCVRFSTSLVIVKILYETNVINLALYSALVTVSAISTMAVPILFAYLGRRWRHAIV
jgi:Kef-type K+ transport system membrane component KefB